VSDGRNTCCRRSHLLRRSHYLLCSYHRLHAPRCCVGSEGRPSLVSSSSVPLVELPVPAVTGPELWLRVEVRDNGVGISPENVSRLFKAFSQIEAGRLQASRGTGLGLYICTQIIRRLGGRIGVDSTLGVGSTFFAEWPVRLLRTPEAEAEPPPTTTAGPTAAQPPRTSPSSALHILVVDDDASSRLFLSRALRRRMPDADLAEADGGAAAVEMVLRRGGAAPLFDVVCLDREMPLVDGPQAARKLRAHGYRGAIIGVTGALQPGEVESFQEAGADAIVAKPVNIAELHGAIRRLTSTLERRPSAEHESWHNE
jgi:CheY-like chemotaxis protein